MFLRRKRSVRKRGEYEYLHIVESIRKGDKVRQKIIGTLGRADKVLASGKIDALIRSLAQFAHHLKVVEASRTPDMQALSSREWGPALVFGSLWEKQGLPDFIRRLAEKRRVRIRCGAGLILHGPAEAVSTGVESCRIALDLRRRMSRL